MTKLEHYKEVEVTLQLHKWENICYWCSKIYSTAGNKKDVVHINIEHDLKHFCSVRCKELWIFHKTIFGDLMP